MISNWNLSRWKRVIAIFTNLLILTGVSNVIAGEIGTEVWNSTYYSPTGAHDGMFEGVDFKTDGNLMVSGFRAEPDSSNAVAIRYHNANGVVLDTPAEWILYDDTWSDYVHDRFWDQLIKSNGDIYFAGTSDDPARPNTWGTRLQLPSVWKYDAAGTLLWKKIHADSNANDGLNYDIAGDASGNVYTAGYFENLVTPGSNKDWLVNKYDSAGNVVTGFPVSYDHEGLHDVANSIATDSKGNLIVVGSVSVDATTDHADWHVRKYDSSGNLLWYANYDLKGLNDAANEVFIDADDNIIVCGYRNNGTLATADYDWYIIKYAKDADETTGEAAVLWEKSWDDGNQLNGIAYGVIGDFQGNLYIVGSQIDSNFGTGMYRSWMQYRDGQTGNLLKEQELTHTVTTNNNPNFEHDYIKHLALKGGQLAATGSTFEGYINYGRTARIAMIEFDVVEVTPVVNGNVTISPTGPIPIRADYPGQALFQLTSASGGAVEIEGDCPEGTLTDNNDGTWNYTTGLITNSCQVIVNFTANPPGDISGNGTVGLEDAISILKVLTGE